MPENNTPSYEPTSWGKSDIFDFETPSGQKCQIHALSLQELVFQGIIDDVDAVSKLVDSKLITPKQTPGRKKQTDAQLGLDFLKSEEAKEAFRLMDAVVVGCVLQPKISPNPAEGETPDPSKIYVRQIDLGDRAAIFAAVMKPVEKTAEFREQSA